MFTGLIAEVGKVESVRRRRASALLCVTCGKVGRDLADGDSISVNGVCLSIVGRSSAGLLFDIVGNTMANTALKRLKAGDKVNLEEALRLGDTMSGHMVSGHVDGERVVKRSKRTGKGWVLDIGILPDDRKYLVSKGSVAIDGVSLTVADVLHDICRIFLIPHTLDNTTLGAKSPGKYVNVEFDVMSKYAEKNGVKERVTMETLREKGFAI